MCSSLNLQKLSQFGIICLQPFANTHVRVHLVYGNLVSWSTDLKRQNLRLITHQSVYLLVTQATDFKHGEQLDSTFHWWPNSSCGVPLDTESSEIAFHCNTSKEIPNVRGFVFIWKTFIQKCPLASFFTTFFLSSEALFSLSHTKWSLPWMSRTSACLKCVLISTVSFAMNLYGVSVPNKHRGY